MSVQGGSRVAPAHPERTRRHALIAVGLMLAAFNLRPALTSVGPLLNRIAEETGIGAGGASLLTTLPVLCLGLAGALGPAVMARLGIDAGVLASLLVLGSGLALRGEGSVTALFAGSALAAGGIGLAGVLIPALVKRDFPHRAGAMTGFYTMVLCIGAAAGAGLTIPLSRATGLGWAGTLALWAVPAFAAALVLAPFARMRAGAVPAKAVAPRLRNQALAWQVTGFMGLQSSLAYILFGWLPALLQSRGSSAIDAGYLASIVTLCQAPGALGIATLAARARDQRGWIAGALAATTLAFLIVATGPDWAMIPAGAVLGFALGGCFALGLSLIVLRAGNAATAGALSAMAQGFGYAIASLGPLGFGLAHDASGGWAWPAALFCAIGLAALACGLGAGRARQIGAGS